MLVLIASLCTSKALRPIVILYLVYLAFGVGPVAGENESRMESGRYLVFPTPGTFVPTKVQIIMGLGLPMEVDVSMIIGYVLKFNYALPYNASVFSHPYALRYDRSIDDPRSIPDKRGEQEEYVDETKEEETPMAERERGGEQEEYVDETKQEETPMAERERGGPSSRWEIYRIIESALDSFQLSGKGCLLKTVCQLARVPFENSRAGLVAQLIRVLLTPSTTREKYQFAGDQEYHAAEAAGRDNRGKCEHLFPECGHDLLEYFTETNDD